MLGEVGGGYITLGKHPLHNLHTLNLKFLRIFFITVYILLSNAYLIVQIRNSFYYFLVAWTELTISKWRFRDFLYISNLYKTNIFLNL